MRGTPALDYTFGANYYQLAGGGHSGVFVDGEDFVIEHQTPTQANIYYDADSTLDSGGASHYFVTQNASSDLAIKAEL